MRFYIRIINCVILCLVTFASNSMAGSFKVFPLKLSLDAHTKTTLFKVINTDENPVIVQLQAANWHQDKNGEDVYDDTREIVLFPKIVKLNPREERVIRIGYQGKPAIEAEKQFRIFAQELPQRNLPGGALNFALRFSVPIFIKPQNERESFAIESSAVEKGLLKIAVSNNGNHNVVVKSFAISGIDESNRQVFNVSENGWYVLPGVVKPFYIALPETECRYAARLNYAVQIASQIFEKSIDVNPADCNKMKKVNNSRF